MDHPIIALFKSYLHAVEAHDWDAVLTYLSDEYVKVIKPSTMGAPVMGKDDVKGHMSDHVEPTYVPGSLKVEIGEVYSISAKGDAATFSALSTGISKLGTPWRMEYMFVIFTDELGMKIKREVQFVDRKAYIDWGAKEAEAAQNV